MENFLKILTKPDNIPIVGMIVIFGWALVWSLWKSWKREEPVGGETIRVHTWPYLTRIEFLAALIVLIVLTVWSILVDAPLEAPANPTVTPNPAKAPWYFLGLQELLVYFDPWIAGVVIPTLILIGLALVPYMDTNTEGAGEYALGKRKFTAAVFLFGFYVLGLAMIVLGVFFRGPGWNFFWPWQYWDPHKVVALTNVNLPQALGVYSPTGAFILSGVCVFLWYSLSVFFYFPLRNHEIIRKRGNLLYFAEAILLLTMLALPVKIILRLLFNIKYIWVTPWFNI